MGRYYRTSNDTPVDYMYKLDTPLMARVLASNDAGITNSLNQTDADDTAVNFNYLPQDEQDAKKLQDSLHSQIHDVAGAIQGDYANWKKQMNPLRQLGQSIKEQYQNGEISKYQGNYNQMKSDFAEADKQSELWHTSGGTKGVDPIAANLWKNKTLRDFKGTKDPTTGAFNRFSSTPLSDTMDINKVLDTTLAGVVKDSSTKEFTQLKGAYFDDTSQSWKGVPQDKLLSVAMSRLMSDPRITENIRQYSDIGYIQGGTNPDGSIRSPFKTTDQSSMSPEESQQINAAQNKINTVKRTNPDQAKEMQEALNDHLDSIANRKGVNWDEGSYLTPFLKGAIQKYSGIETKTSEKLRNNSFANLGVSEAGQDRRLGFTQGQENLRQQNSFTQQKVMADINHGYKLDEMQQAAANKANKGTGSKAAGDKQVGEATILAQPTSTPYAYMATDPVSVAANLKNKIVDNNNNIINLYKEKAKATTDGDSDKANYIANQISDVISQQATLGQRDAKAQSDALNKVVPKTDQDLYANADKIIEDYSQAMNRNAVTQRQAGGGNTAALAYYGSPQGKADAKTIQDYHKVMTYKKQVDATYKQNLVDALKNTTNSATEVETTNANDGFLRQAITTSPSEFKILDPNTGAEIANFQDGKIDPNMKDFHIVGAGPSSGSGSKTMNIYATYKGKNIQIVPTGASAGIVRDHLMGDWSKSGDTGVKQLTKTWSSPYFKAVNDATTDIVQGDTNPLGLGATHYSEIGLPNGQARIGITKVGTAGFKVQIEGNNGWINVPNTDATGKSVGDYFTSNSDIVDALDKLDAKIREKK